jgi:chemotaxis protein MotB
MAPASNEKSTAQIRIIKKKVVHGGHHGGAWKVAYADFVTAMMAFFLVMWIIGLSQSIKQAVSGYFKDPTGFMDAVKGGNAPFMINQAVSNGKDAKGSSNKKESSADERARLKKAKASIEALIAKTPQFSKLRKHIDVKLVDEGLKIDLLEDEQNLFFDSGSAKIKPATKLLLSGIAQELGKLPNSIIMEGHTDCRPLAHTYINHYSNWELSADRANSARWVMEDAGLRKDQVAQIRGYASRQLRDPDHPDGFSNRRVSIIVMIRGEMKNDKELFNIDRQVGSKIDITK